MLIGVISDTHDNIWNLEKVIKQLKEKRVETLIHCGDFCGPFIINILAETNIPVHCVFGNTDDQFKATRFADATKNVTLHGELAEIELAGKKIAVTHLPQFAEGLAYTGKYDVVFYGHTHKKDNQKIGNSLLVNPGEVMGKAGVPSFAVYNTENNEVEFNEI